MFAHQVGQVVRVEVHSKTNEVKLDPHTRAHSVSDPTSTVDRRPSLVGDLTPGAPVAPGGFGSASRQPADLASELVELRQAMRSGDPAARQAAHDRLHELRTERSGTLERDPAAQQAAMERIRQRVAERSGQPGAAPAAANTGSPRPAAPSTFDPIGQPSTFDPVGPASTFNPVGPASTANTFGDPVRETFNQPAAPSSFGHVTEPPSFGAPAAFDQFGGGAGAQEQQLAKLQQLFDKGILTESELAAQRQQILNG